MNIIDSEIVNFQMLWEVINLNIVKTVNSLMKWIDTWTLKAEKWIDTKPSYLFNYTVKLDNWDKL